MPLQLDTYARTGPHSLSGSASALEPRAGLRSVASLGRHVKARLITTFASQLALMLEVGTPLATAIKSLVIQTKNTAFRAVLVAVEQDLEGGRQLSDAFARHPRAFDDIFISMVRAGEAGGFLKKILDRVVEVRLKREALRSQLRAALTYPAVLCTLSMVVVVFILVGVLPKFTTFFAGKEQILPPTTKMLMGTSDALRNYWWGYLLGLGAAVGAWKLFAASPVGRSLVDRFLISVPPFSKLMNKIYTTEMLRTLGNLLQSDVPLLEALRVTQQTIRNVHYRRNIDLLMEQVSQGGRFAHVFSAIPFIQESVRQMVATGEEAGTLDTVMLRLADFYDIEVEQDLKAMAALIEPAALMVMGTIIGVMVSSIILPMFKLAHAIK